jgi:ergothioneine biosynthesis protein EgtB
MHSNSRAQPSSVEYLLNAFHASRKYSTELITHLSPEDCQAQSMEDASPAKWHLAHVTWFYEVMVLKPFEKNFQYWHSAFAVLFNSYYNGVGDKHPRFQRGLLTRPTLHEVLAWRQNINERIEQLLLDNPLDEVLALIELGINHEQQHQELLLTDIQHLFFQSALLPAYSTELSHKPIQSASTRWITGIAGLVEIGYSGAGFHFDNEGPRHTTFNQAHALSNQLISNAEWLLFIDSGAYQQAQWWLDAGWAWVESEQITAPLYWNIPKDSAQYYQFTLYGNIPLQLDHPVAHISYFEADAFARWASRNLTQYAGARLPTESEWEAFVQQKSHDAINLFGQVWQWTSSSYSAYPGYKPWRGIAGEYNGKFMVNQMVLRGSSALTTSGHSRHTYRNFFPTQTRWQMTGLRLAKDGI